MKTEIVFAVLLFGCPLSAHAAGIGLDLGLCDKTPDLTAVAPQQSPVPKAKKKAAAAKTAAAATAGARQQQMAGAAVPGKEGSALAR
jgi:hypothetical protein